MADVSILDTHLALEIVSVAVRVDCYSPSSPPFPATCTYSPGVSSFVCVATGDFCYRDAAGNPSCSTTDNHNNNFPPPTTTTYVNYNTITTPNNPPPVTTSSTTLTTPKTTPPAVNTNTTPPKATPITSSKTSSSSSSTADPNNTGLPDTSNTNSNASGATSWKASWSFVAAVPALGLIGMYT